MGGQAVLVSIMAVLAIVLFCVVFVEVPKGGLCYVCR
jgi:hypothetical protein